MQRIPLIWFIDRIATDRRVMGDARSGWLSRTTLVIAFIGMAGSVVTLAISYLKGWPIGPSRTRPSAPAWRAGPRPDDCGRLRSSSQCAG